MKSNTINSAVLVGWIKIWPLNSFLSTTSGVLFVSSITTLNAVNPEFACTDSKNGFTIPKNLFLVVALFCSNTKNLEEAAINRFLNIANPYLLNIKEKSGLNEFKVVMDATNNTPDVVDRNILYGQIFVQPTKTAEFIVLDFTIQPTGASFPE